MVNASDRFFIPPEEKLTLFDQRNTHELPSMSIHRVPIFFKTGFCVSPLASLAVLSAVQLEKCAKFYFFKMQRLNKV